jgi:formate--tetrahydrofolate ligase
MSAKSSIEIAQDAKLENIIDVAGKIGLDEHYLELYGRYKAKVSLDILKGRQGQQKGKLIVVSCMTGTKAGEGKTTVAIGLGQSLGLMGKKGIVCIRQPSLGPVFGIKGGGAGGGYSQVQPMDEINLHFTGDLHAISSAHNLLAAVLDNHLFQGNDLDIDLHSIIWKRVLDMNDRVLRSIVIGLGGKRNGIPRQDSFEITAASEIAAILALANDLADLKERLSRIIVAYSEQTQPVTAADLKISGAMALLLKDSLKPNLVQTLEHTPVFVHGGPFANIAHGCPSLISIRIALCLADYVIVEPGFGADLGAEKFFDIVCPLDNLHPNLVVLVATIRALKHHAGVHESKLAEEDADAVLRGTENLEKHIEIIQRFKIPIVVALNRFHSDTPAEIRKLGDKIRSMNIRFAVTEVFTRGGEGGKELAAHVIEAISQEPSDFQTLYEETTHLRDKILHVAEEIYGSKDVIYTDDAQEDIRLIEDLGLEKLPICIAKTQFSLSDNPDLLGRPRDFKITITGVKPRAGAGFLVVYTGDINTMPGLPKIPAAEIMDINQDGKITGLF